MAVAWVFPGQGSQRRGMGEELFARFPDRVAAAEEVLGYAIPPLCREDPGHCLRDTRYTQPLLFVVNALAWLARAERGPAPAFLAGHSLGELNALFAAGCFDFETGVRLVRRRGELMARAAGGGMAAVVGLPPARVRAVLAERGLDDACIANDNAPEQVVISGPRPSVDAAAQALRHAGARCVPLEVSAAFHSPQMEPAAAGFAELLAGVALADPRVPVLSNVTARPYEPGSVRRVLGEQIRSPVRWRDSMQWLMEHGVDEVEEIGPGRVLTGLWAAARRAAPASPAPAAAAADAAPSAVPAPFVVSAASAAAGPAPASAPPAAGWSCAAPAADPLGALHGARLDGREDAPAAPRPPAAAGGRGAFLVAPERLGSAEFRRDYGIRYAYLAGAMYNGIASSEMVVRLGRRGLMGFFGAGGVGLDETERALLTIQRELGADGPYGMNLLYPLDDPRREEDTVALYLRRGVRFVEAAGYTQVTAPLVRFRFSGAARGAGGRPRAERRVLAKVSRPEVAAAFMRPAPQALVERLRREGTLTAEEAEAAARLPVSQDVCVESDSGGHTDGGVALALVPAMLRLRDEAMARHGYPERIRVGAAGGIGAPEAAAAAFMLGADFVLTGSVNQCSPQAGTSPAVKDLLAGLDVHDTTHAPAGDMFELGARVQVVRKGTLFPARANRLYQVYRQYDALEQVDADVRATIENSYFRRSFHDVWREARDHLGASRPDDVRAAERNPKRRMAMVFRWYFGHASRAAIEGVAEERVNWQIQCGPAIGAFNHAVRGTELEDWRARHVDLIAERLMHGAADVLGDRLRSLTGAA